MKYILIIGDGMADKPVPDGKTPLESARTPALDYLASCGVMGCATGPTPILPADGNAPLRPGNNYEGTADEVIASLECGNSVSVRAEFPPGTPPADKIRDIELLDSHLIAPLTEKLSGQDYRLMVLATSQYREWFLYTIYDSRKQARRLARFTEAEALAGQAAEDGNMLLSRFFEL